MEYLSGSFDDGVGKMSLHPADSSMRTWRPTEASASLFEIMIASIVLANAEVTNLTTRAITLCQILATQSVASQVWECY